MSMQDLVSDFIARINNSLLIGKDEVIVKKTKLTINICKKLTKMGFFNKFSETSDFEINVELNLAKLLRLKRFSKPGKRVYVSSKKFPSITDGLGYNILTTSQGILTHIEAKNKIGGEVLLQVISKPVDKLPIL